MPKKVIAVLNKEIENVGDKITMGNGWRNYGLAMSNAPAKMVMFQQLALTIQTKKKDGELSKPQPKIIDVEFMYCPFCGKEL